MKKLVTVLIISLASCTGTEDVEITEKPKPKKIYRLIGVKKDSTRVILGNFSK